VAWLLVAGAGRALLGGPARPGDLDLETAREDAAAAAAALGLPAPAEDRGARLVSLRSVGALGGVPLDLSGGLTVLGPDGPALPAPAWRAQRAAAIPVLAAGRTVLVGPPEEDLVRRVVAGDHAGAARLAAGLPEGFALRPAYLALRLSAAASAAR